MEGGSSRNSAPPDGCGTSAVHPRSRRHQDLVQTDVEYAARAAEMLCEALRIDWNVDIGSPSGGDAEPAATSSVPAP